MSSIDLFDAFAVPDRAILLWLQSLHGHPLLDRIAEWSLTSLLLKFMPLELAICACWFARSEAQAARRRMLMEALCAGVAGLFVARALALLLPFRPRPFLDPSLDIALPFDAGLRTWSAFPSDHAVMAAALATALFRLSPKLGVWAALHAALAICLPRLYFGLHYPTDIVGGALIGIAIAWFLPRLRVCSSAFDRLLAIERDHPAWFYPAGFVLLFEIAEMFSSVRGLVAGAFHIIGGSA